MKVTLRHLYAVGSMNVLTVLAMEPRANVPEKTAYWVGKMLRKLQIELRTIEEKRQAVVKEFAPPPDADGKPVPMSPEQNAAADGAFGAFLDVETDFDFQPFARTEFSGCRNISEAQLMTLEDAGLLIDAPAATV